MPKILLPKKEREKTFLIEEGIIEEIWKMVGVVPEKGLREEPKLHTDKTLYLNSIITKLLDEGNG